MNRLYTLFAFLVISGVLSAQTIVNPFDSHRNAFNQRDFISVINHPNQSVKQQIFVYDWIQAFNQNSWSNIEPASNDYATVSNASSGYITIETGNFNGDSRDDVFYVNEYLGKWTYGAIDQSNSEFVEEDSLYSFTLQVPDFIDGATLDPTHSHPCVALGDVDGNGIDDAIIVWSQGNNSEIYIQVVTVDTEGGFTCNPKPAVATGLFTEKFLGISPIAMAAGDFDGDDIYEIAISGVQETGIASYPYEGFVTVFEFTNDGNFTPIAGPSASFAQNLIVEEDDDSGSLGYVRTTLEAIRTYPTQDEEGGQESIFAALAHDRQNEGGNYDYDWFRAEHLVVSDDLTTVTIDGTGVSMNTTTYEFQANSPFESHSGEVSDDLIDEVIVLTDRFMIFNFEDGELQIGNNGNVGVTSPILDFDNNPYQESVDRFDVGDVNRDGIDDIICQTKTFDGGGQGMHDFYIQAFSVYPQIVGNDTITHYAMEQSGAYTYSYESGQSLTNYAFALGNLDGNDLCLGEPIEYTCDYVRPHIILEGIPNHFDVIDGEELDVNGCYAMNATTCPNGVTFINTIGDQESSANRVNRDWAVSGEVSAGFAIGGFGMSGSLGYKYGEQFEQLTSNTEAFSLTITSTATTDDAIGLTTIDFFMLEYPVLDAAGDTITWIVAAFPNQQAMPQSIVRPSKEVYNYIPNHEVGNILSYPKPNSEDMFYDRSPDENWMIYDGFDALYLSSGAISGFSILSETSSALESSSTQTQTLSASIGATGFGLGAQVNGEYTTSETQVFGQTLTEAEEFHITPGEVPLGSTYAYTIVPSLYWTVDRCPKLGMAVDFSVSGGAWQELYGQKPDPALNMPYKFNYLHLSNYIEEDLDRTRSVYFDKINPNPGDTVTATIRIFNYSLMSMNQNIEFHVYNGHPDQGGTLIEGLDGTTLFSTEEILEDQGRTLVNVSFIVTPDMIGNDNVKIYFELDPNDLIDETYENNNLAWTNLGYVCNTMGGPVFIDDFHYEDHTFTFSMYPNPSSNFVTVDYKERMQYLSERLVLRVFDLNGRQILEKNMSQSTTGQFTFDVSQLITGMYVVQISTDTEMVYNAKLIVQ